QEVVSIPPGQSVKAVLPLPRPPPGPLTGHGAPAVPAPLGQAAAAPSAAAAAGLAGGGGVRWTPPAIRLLVDVTSGQVPLTMLGGHQEGSPASASLADLVCLIQVRREQH
ncbi:hypothetical protein DUNSADRAFT_14362, partial [Dunaliella salina]